MRSVHQLAPVCTSHCPWPPPGACWPSHAAVRAMAALQGVEKVVFGNDVPGYVCGSVKDPAVIVIQEWWGVVPTVVEHAVKLSQQGYR